MKVKLKKLVCSLGFFRFGLLRRRSLPGRPSSERDDFMTHRSFSPSGSSSPKGGQAVGGLTVVFFKHAFAASGSLNQPDQC